jgi:hypothetical protein
MRSWLIDKRYLQGMVVYLFVEIHELLLGDLELGDNPQDIVPVPLQDLGRKCLDAVHGV